MKNTKCCTSAVCEATDENCDFRKDKMPLSVTEFAIKHKLSITAIDELNEILKAYKHEK